MNLIPQQPVGPRADRAGVGRRRDRDGLVARAGVGARRRRLPARRVVVDLRGDRRSTCSRSSRARSPGGPSSIRRCRRTRRRSGGCSPRSRSGCSATRCCPARTGELARVAVLTRGYPRGQGYTATLLGTVFTHRLFDVIPAMLLVVYVLLTAKIPHWALTSFAIAAALGGILLVRRAGHVAPAQAGRRGAEPVAPPAGDGARRAGRAALSGRCRGCDLLPVPRVAASSCSRSGSRCARSTSTRRCPRRGSCWC